MTVPLDQKTVAIPYRVCGLTLSCNVPLPELAHVTHVEPREAVDVRVELSGQRPQPAHPAHPAHWFMTWNLLSGEPWLSTAKTKGGYLLRFYDLADFTVDTKGGEIICFPEPDTPDDTLRHLLLDQVVPLVLTLHGRHALHATAVLTHSGVCAFAGPAGAGKSTLAASFLLAGYPVLCDDCLVLQERHRQIMATPAYPGLRLWDDAYDALCVHQHHPDPVAHYTSKRRLAFQDSQGVFSTESQPLAGIYILAQPSGTETELYTDVPLIESLTPRDGFIELLLCMFRLDITNRMMLQRQFHFLHALVSRVPVKRLHAPQTFASLPATRDAILKDLTDG